MRNKIINGFMILSIGGFIAYGAHWKAKYEVLEADYKALRYEYILSLSELERWQKPVGGTLAEQNNNPLNVKALKYDTWQGQIGIDKHGHVVFDTPEHGIRAAAYVLKNYSMRHGIDTVQGIVKRFATGNQEAYVKFLCHKLNVQPEEKIDIIRRMADLLKAMARFESGRTWPDHMFNHYDILAYL